MGVWQGETLSPITFLIINDAIHALCYILGIEVKLYAKR